MKKPLSIVLLLLVLAAGLAWGWRHFGAEKQETAAAAGMAKAGPAPGAAKGGPPAGAMGPMPVGAVPVEARDIEVTIDAVGSLEASESAEIRVETAGAVQAVNFTEGQPVKKGASLIEIDGSLIRAELMKAEATYNVRQTTFSRSDRLKSSGYVSNQDWEQSKGSLQEARADIESARIRLDKTKVRAPFDGIAGLRNYSVGDYIQVGQALTTVDAVDPMKASFSVPEKNYGDIRIGQQVSFSVDAWPQDTFSGEIYVVSPRIEQDTRNFEVKAKIPNAEGKLRPGMFARIRVVTATRPGALLVPEQALIPKGDENYVFVVRDGKAVSQKIATGLRQPGAIEVTEGLAAGEPVIVTGLMTLREGTPVTVTAP